MHFNTPIVSVKLWEWIDWNKKIIDFNTPIVSVKLEEVNKSNITGHFNTPIVSVKCSS